MIQRSHLALSGLASVLVASAVYAATSPVVQQSAVKFEAAGPAGLKINGESSGVKATEADGKIKLTAPTTEFHTRHRPARQASPRGHRSRQAPCRDAARGQVGDQAAGIRLGLRQRLGSSHAARRDEDGTFQIYDHQER